MVVGRNGGFLEIQDDILNFLTRKEFLSKLQCDVLNLSVNEDLLLGKLQLISKQITLHLPNIFLLSYPLVYKGQGRYYKSDWMSTSAQKSGLLVLLPK